jgi:hypothetical protein
MNRNEAARARPMIGRAIKYLVFAIKRCMIFLLKNGDYLIIKNMVGFETRTSPESHATIAGS